MPVTQSPQEPPTTAAPTVGVDTLTAQLDSLVAGAPHGVSIVEPPETLG
jgi:hypothetical protein